VTSWPARNSAPLHTGSPQVRPRRQKNRKARKKKARGAPPRLIVNRKVRQGWGEVGHGRLLQIAWGIPLRLYQMRF
jgi:hypothetical protein